jgi:hypothetical protein
MNANENNAALASDPAEQIHGYIELLREKIGRITACHASLLALANQFDKTTIPQGPDGMLCPDFVFPTLLNSISPDVDGITTTLWDLEKLLEELDGKKGDAQ